MTKEQDLERAVDNFRKIETALDDFAAQTKELTGAGQQLTEARGTLEATRSSLSEALERHASVTEQLTSLAGLLAETTEVVRQGEPTRIANTVEHLVTEFERHKERISEMSGTVQTRIEESTRTVSASITESKEQVSAAQEKYQAETTGLLTKSLADISSMLPKVQVAVVSAIQELERSLGDRIARAETVFTQTAQKSHIAMVATLKESAKNTEEQIAKAERRVRIPAVTAAVLSGLALVLAIVALFAD